MLKAFQRLPVLSQNIILGVITIAVAMPIYTVPNILFGERPGMSLATPLDHAIPFVPWSVFAYSLIYVFVFLPVFTIKHRIIFLRVIVAFLLCSLMALPFFIFFPVRMPRPGIPTQELLAYWAVALSYTLDKPVNCFPSLHVANAVLAVASCYKLSRRVALWGMVGALAVAISTTTMKQHFIADILGGIALALISYFLVVHPVIRRYSAVENSDTLIFPPQTAMWVLYLYGIFVSIFALLFYAGLRVEPVLPVN